MPSPVDAKSLRDLEVMKLCHDITLVITEESLRSIREHYNIPEEYALRAPSPDQRPYKSAMDLNVLCKKLKASGETSSSVAQAVRSPPEVEEIHVEAMPKRSAGSVAPKQVATTRPGKQVKIAVKKISLVMAKGAPR
ncbi:hypothetical protein BHM03_00048729 [Ensete ventricosum]|nr:hypothetical protein BHM03_00048729 [Ensete ventricosum]